MSKLAYSDEVDTGGEGWNENFGDDLPDLDISETVSGLPEPPEIEEAEQPAAASHYDSHNDEDNQQVPHHSEETVQQFNSDVTSNVENADAVVEPPPSEVHRDFHHHVHNNEHNEQQHFEVTSPADEVVPEPELPPAAPITEENAPQPLLLPPPPPPEPISHAPPIMVAPESAAPHRTDESHQMLYTAPPPAQPQHRQQPHAVPTLTFPAPQIVPPKTTPVADLTKLSTAHVRSAVVAPSAPSPTTVLNSSVGGEPGARKPLQLPQAQIKYRQPLDYSALLSNAAARTAAITRVNQPPGAAPNIAAAAAAVLRQTHQPSPVQQHTANSVPATSTTQSSAVNAAARQPVASYTSKINPNMVSYPPQQQPLKNGPVAPVAAKPAEQPAPVPKYPTHHQAAVPQQQQPVQQYQQPMQQYQPAVLNATVPRSQTLPDVTDQQQLQAAQGYYQPGTNGDGYSSEHDGPTPKTSSSRGNGATNSEERRSKKHRHRPRPSYQPPPVDAYAMGQWQENPQYYAEQYRQYYEQQARLYGSYSGASTPAAYDPSESDTESYGAHSRPSSRMSLSNYVSPQNANPYQTYQQYAAGGYDQAAAWWYWYYMQQQQMQEQQKIPQRPSTPKKFAYAHCRASFSASGFLVIVVPGRHSYATGSPANRVNVIKTFDTISPALPELKQYTDFPGPLVPNESHKMDVINFAQRMSQQALASDYIDRDSVNLLWRFIELLVRQNGTYFGADISQLLTDSLPALPETLVEPADQAIIAPAGSINQLRELLLHGRKREAVEFAMNHNLWAHAMFLSHSISEQYFLAVRNRFLNSSAAPGDPLATFYQLATLSSPVISRQAVTSDMHSWRQHLAVVLSNAAVSPQFQRQLLLSLGDTLRSQGRLYAAQLCYLMAGDQFSAFPPPSISSDGISTSTRMILLGTEPCGDFAKLATPYFTQLTEIYEYCLRLANPRAALPAFQLFKTFYCLCLAEVGLVHEAFRYLMSVIECLQISFTAYPSAAVSFPRICFKWLADLYTALHKSEPAVDYATIDWIFVAAKGGPIQPPPLQQTLMASQQPQQQQNSIYGNGRPDDFRHMTQTPGPFASSTHSQNSMLSAPTPQLYNHQPTPTIQHQPQQPYQQQPQQQQQLDQHNQQQQYQQQPPQFHPTPNHHQVQPQQSNELPFGKSYGSSLVPGSAGASQNSSNTADSRRPFDESRRFEKSMSRRSDGGSDQVGFGSSMESMTWINKEMSDMRKAAMNFAANEAHPNMSEQPPQPSLQRQPSAEPPAQQHQHQYQNNQHVEQPVEQQPYVPPVPTWQPPAVSAPPAPMNDYASTGQPPRQQQDMNRDAAPTPPPSQNDKSPKKGNDGKAGTPSGGLFSSIWPFGGKDNTKPGPKKMVLPDDKKPTLVWDPAKNRWVDTANPDGDAASEVEPPPPPPMMAAPQMNAQPPLMMGGPGAGASAMSAPTAMSMQRPRGRYVDVFKPAGSGAETSNGPTNSMLRPPLFPAAQQQTFFVPPSVPDPSS